MRKRALSVGLPVLTLALSGCSGDASPEETGVKQQGLAPAVATPNPSPQATTQSTTGPVGAAPGTGAGQVQIQGGRVLVRFEASTSKQVRRRMGSAKAVQANVLPSALASVRTKLKMGAVKPIVERTVLSNLKRRVGSKLGGGRGAALKRLEELYIVEIDPYQDPEAVARELRQHPLVQHAEPDLLVEAAFVPNDEFFNATDAWGLHKIDAPAAWDTTSGAGVVVAVVDSGVDINHSDLAANIYENAAEIPDNDIDDDGNGFVDDVHGWDFHDGDEIADDPNGHGTHVAGTIAAVANNSDGVAGVAHSAKIMPLRGLGADGSGSTSNLVQAMIYAVENGADVINNSWGGSGRSTAVADAIELARDNGVVVVNAAGNSNRDACTFSPANSELGITVAAVGPTDAKAGFSNYGTKIDVSAPGGDGSVRNASRSILSTLPDSSEIEASKGAATLGTDGGKYIAISGTSMASPHVAGVAALLVAQHPNWTTDQIRQAIRAGADDLGPAGFDTTAGHGRLNAQGALTAYLNAPSVASLTVPYSCSELEGTEDVQGTALLNSGVASFEISWGAGTAPSSFTPLLSGSGNIDDASFGSIDTLSMPDGENTLRLVTLPDGVEDRNSVTVNNIYLTAPAEGAVFSDGSIDVAGRVAGNLGFSEYRLEYATGWDSTGPFTEFATGSTQVSPAGPLGSLSIAALPDGPISLRLTVDFAAHSTIETRNVVIDRRMKLGFPVLLTDKKINKHSPQVTDIDADGNEDIILGAAAFEATGLVRSGWNNDAGTSRTNSAIANLDADPELEIIAGVTDFAQENSTVFAYNEDKSVLWSYAVTHPTPEYKRQFISSLSIADLDDDGELEVAFSSYLWVNNPDNTTRVFVLDAQTGAEESVFDVEGKSVGAIALADIDTDGVTDLVLSSHDFEGERGWLQVLHADGTPAAGFPYEMEHTTWDLYSEVDPVIADVDRDYRYEILVGRHLVNHDGTAVAGFPAPLGGGTGVLAQLEGSVQNKEVVVGYAYPELLNFYQHDGTHLFTAQMGDENQSFGGWPASNIGTSPIVFDVNADGSTDVIMGSVNGYGTPRPVSLYAYDVASGSEVSDFKIPVTTSYPKFWSGLFSGPIHSTPTVADLDQDGSADLLVAGGRQLQAWDLGVPYSESSWPRFARDLQNTGTHPLCPGATLVSASSDIWGIYGFGPNGTAIRGVESIAQAGDFIAVVGTGTYDGVWEVERTFNFGGYYTYHIPKPWEGMPSGWGVTGGPPSGSTAQIYVCSAPPQDECNQTVEVVLGPEGEDAIINNLVKTGIDNTVRNWPDHPSTRSVAWTHGGVPHSWRSLLKFALPDLPPNAQVKEALLSLYARTQGTFDPYGGAHSQYSHENSSILQRVTSSWEESTVTWSTQPTVSTADQINIPASSDPNQDYGVDVTEWTQGVYDGSYENLGYLLRLNAEQRYSSLNFWSGDAPEEAERPRLTITYECRQ